MGKLKTSSGYHSPNPHNPLLLLPTPPCLHHLPIYWRKNLGQRTPRRVFRSTLLLRVWADSNLASKVGGNSTAKHFWRGWDLESLTNSSKCQETEKRLRAGRLDSCAISTYVRVRTAVFKDSSPPLPMVLLSSASVTPCQPWPWSRRSSSWCVIRRLVVA